MKEFLKATLIRSCRDPREVYINIDQISMIEVTGPECFSVWMDDSELYCRDLSLINIDQVVDSSVD